MDNPNVAPAGKARALLDTVPGYQLSNADAVSGAKYTFGKQSPIAAQPSMAPRGSQPAFEQLQPKAISTNPGPMGTDHKP